MLTSLIVVTDLDGTLLDHYSYRYEAALPALQKLRDLHIPLILNSSKTAAEIRVLRAELGNHHPFIVENGAGIYVPAPADYDPPGGPVKPAETLEKVALGIPRTAILSVLQKLRQERGYQFTGFADLEANALASLTGLNLEQAERALQRDFTEPVLWQDSVAAYREFCTLLQEAGIGVLKGGRFIHLSAPLDKGMAVDWLKQYYQRLCGRQPRVIALGDSDNDRAMLERADYPVLIKSPVHDGPDIRHPGLLRTEEEGPAGWNAAVMAVLASLSGR